MNIKQRKIPDCTKGKIKPPLCHFHLHYLYLMDLKLTYFEWISAENQTSVF